MICQKCKKEFKPVNNNQIACSVECAIALSKLKKGIGKAISIIKQEERTRKELTEPIQRALARTKRVFQDAIRRRDKDEPCIRCGTYRSETFHAGHYKEATTFKGLIFDERNCHKQCSRCNTHLSGNLIEYRNGLINRLGLDIIERLEYDAALTKKKRYTTIELKEIRQYYSKKWKT